MQVRTLSVQECQQFQQDGFLVLPRQVPAADTDELLAIIHAELAAAHPPLEYEAEVCYPGSPSSLDAPGGRTVRRLLGAAQRHPRLLALATDAAMQQLLQPLLGARILLVQAHHNCIMTKHPSFSSVTGWHRDIRYWHYQQPALVSLWLALGDEYPDNGGLHFIPGSHQLALAPERFDERMFLREDDPDNRKLLQQAVCPRLQRGDVVLFHCNLLHAARHNQTPHTKLSLVFTYRSAENAPVPDTRSAQGVDMELHRPQER